MSTPRRPPAGCRPTDLEADLVVCHAYKWLCAPRGAAFAALSRSRRSRSSRRCRRLVVGDRSVGLVLRPRPAPRRRREPLRRLPRLARLGGRGGRARSRRIARRRRGARPRGRPRERLPRAHRHRAVGQRDRDLARRRRYAPGGAQRPRASPRRAAPVAPVWRSTCGTTRRTSTSPRARSVAEREPDRRSHVSRTRPRTADAARSARPHRGSTACRAPTP